MKNLFWLAVLCSTAYGAVTLSGTVTDPASKALAGASVTLTGLSNLTFVDSALTGSNGVYAFSNISVGTYRLSLKLAGFVDKDSSVIIGSSSAVCNFVLAPIVVPSGTLHSGIVRGTWLPSGNPHRIIDTAIVTDSLVIAPGCSVIIDVDKQLTIEGNLSVGSPSGMRTSINGGTINGNNSTSSIYFAGTKFNLHHWSPLICNRIMFDSVDCQIGWNNVVISAGDSITILKTRVQGSPIEPGGYAVCTFTTKYLQMSQSFCTATDVKLYCDSSASISYCVSDFTVEIYTLIPKMFFNHCNFQNLEFQNNLNFKSSSASDTILNNILVYLYGSPYASILYTSPFRHNIIQDEAQGKIVFGLLVNTQTNVNGDSCDIWFNMHSDPLFVDNSLTTLSSLSPAIGAASDGTNIGYYQGKGVISSVSNGNTTKGNSTSFSIQALPNRNILIPAAYTKSPFTIFIYDMSGRCIFRKALAGTKGKVLFPLNFSTGAYIGAVVSNGRAWTSKFVLHE
jgi:Carboxypeptidase regulatory-like domain